MDNKQIISSIEKYRAIAILRSDSPDNVQKAAEAIIQGGLPLVEVSITTPEACGVISALRGNNTQAVIGAGTVNTVDDVKKVTESGAQFVFSPIFNPEMVSYCRDNKIVCIPGVFTPSEVYQATAAGADFIKLFPSSIGGPAYIKAIMAPLPESRIIAVGGVSLENLKDYFNAGAKAVGIASCLFSKTDIQEGNYSKITSNTEKFLKLSIKV